MTSFSTAQEPVPEGMDLSGAPMDTPAPEASVPPAGQPEAAPSITEPEPDAPPREHAAGMVTIYAVPPMGTLTIPGDGDTEAVVIDRNGTEVDEATAQRAREAAAASGFTIREE